MDDLISKKEAIDAVVDELDRIDHVPQWVFDVLSSRIKSVPSAEPQIIHCKDCKWKDGSECLRFAEIRIFPNDFCSRAERRTDEE